MHLLTTEDWGIKLPKEWFRLVTYWRLC